MDALRQDLRDALRSLYKNRGYSLVAFVTLAVAIGANTALFSVVDAVLLRSLPFRDPESLVLLWGNVEREEVERRGASVPDFFDWRRESESFVDLAAYWDGTVTLYADDTPERLAAEVVSPSYFELLGTDAALGRLFVAEEETPGAPGAAVLSDGLWRRRFGADPGVVGRTLRLGETDYTVVGVTKAAFRGLDDEAELWLNLGSDLDAESAADRGSRWFPVLGRLRPGVDAATAEAELTAISRQLEAAYPDTNEKRAVEVASLREETVGEVRPLLWVAQAAVSIVLLLAVANVAGLSITRAERRRRDLALRAALGAGRGRLARLLLVEGIVLTLCAAAAGILLATWLVDALMAASPLELPGFTEVELSTRVLAASLGVATLLGLSLGLVMVARGPGRDLPATLRDGSRRTVGGRGASRARSALVVSEVALALVLLVGAGLLLRSLESILAVDPGFAAEGTLTLRVDLPSLEPPAADETASDIGAAAAARILERLGALPGVEHAALGSDVPYGSSGAMFYAAEGRGEGDATNRPRAYLHRATPDFFAALGVPLLAGRTFRREEVEDGTLVAVVSEPLARRFWPGESTIGKRLKPNSLDAENPWIEIVGVVPELLYRGVPANPTADPDIFLPFQETRRSFSVVLRSALPPEGLTRAAVLAVRDVEPLATVYDVETLAAALADETARPRFAGSVTALFAVVALFLAAIGLYGVVAESMRSRVREIAVRIALGATPRQVARMVLRQGLRLAILGALGGLAASLALGRTLEGLLYGIGHSDPATLAAGATLVVGAALAATWIPARRALRTDPIEALRNE